MESNPKRREAFANNMSYMQSRHGIDTAQAHLISAFDWISARKVIDFGGGLGDTAAEIIKYMSETICVVQDLSDVIAIATEMKSREMEPRIRFMPHKLLLGAASQGCRRFLPTMDIARPVRRGSYFRILQALIPALTTGMHVIVQEFIVPDSGTVPFYV